MPDIYSLLEERAERFFLFTLEYLQEMERIIYLLKLIRDNGFEFFPSTIKEELEEMRSRIHARRRYNERIVNISANANILANKVLIPLPHYYKENSMSIYFTIEDKIEQYSIFNFPIILTCKPRKLVLFLFTSAGLPELKLQIMYKGLGGTASLENIFKVFDFSYKWKDRFPKTLLFLLNLGLITEVLGRFLNIWKDKKEEILDVHYATDGVVKVSASLGTLIVDYERYKEEKIFVYELIGKIFEELYDASLSLLGVMEE